MISPEYSVYLKTSSGLRGAYLNDVVSVDIIFRWNEVTKWTITGSGLTACPFGRGAEIIIYRGSEPFLSGFATSIEDSYDAVSGIYDWTVDGEDDLGKLAFRVMYPDPASDEIKPPGEVYSATGHFTDILLDAISHNICLDANLTARRIATLQAHAREEVGDEVTISSEYEELLDFVLSALEDGSYGIRSVWDGTTGKSTIEIYTPRNVSSTVVFSVEAGSLSGWSRRRSAPKANVILAIGVEVTDENDEGTGVWQTATVSDTDSINQWGRRELYVRHSDIKRIVVEESWESVQTRLEQAAMNDLIENSGHDGYELSVVELDRMAYNTHWDIGDIVSVRIADIEMTAPIMEIKISYAGGIETVTPSVGELQKGELESVFDALGNLKKSVKILQNK